MAKANMSLTRNPMPTQDAKVRGHNFDEVALGYSEETAMDEAMRCLNCKNMPCVDGCPVKIRIPEFIGKIKEGDFEPLNHLIKTNNSGTCLYRRDDIIYKTLLCRKHGATGILLIACNQFSPFSRRRIGGFNCLFLCEQGIDFGGR